MRFNYNSLIELSELGQNIIKQIGETGRNFFLLPINEVCQQNAFANLILGYPWIANTIGSKSIAYVLLVTCLSLTITTECIKLIIKLFIKSGLPLL